jgi:amidase
MVAPDVTGSGLRAHQARRFDPGQQERTDYAMAIASYAAPFNLTGSPVVVMPAGRNVDGLPIGVQLVGRRWDDDRLLAVADRVAGILGGFRAPPGY